MLTHNIFVDQYLVIYEWNNKYRIRITIFMVIENITTNGINFNCNKSLKSNELLNQ